MFWFWIIITVLLVVISIVCFVFMVALANDGDKNSVWLLLGFICFIVASGFSANQVRSITKKQESKYIIISTSILPQIDTTITYSVGKTDTVYVYHFIKEIQSNDNR